MLSSRQERFGGWRPGSTTLTPLLAAIGTMIAGALGVAESLSSSGSAPDKPSGSGVSVWFWVAGGAILLAAFVAVAWRMAAGPNRAPRATIVLAYRADAPTWWERNRNPVLIGLVTNVGTGLLFFLLGLWLGGR